MVRETTGFFLDERIAHRAAEQRNFEGIDGFWHCLHVFAISQGWGGGEKGERFTSYAYRDRLWDDLEYQIPILNVSADCAAQILFQKNVFETFALRNQCLSGPIGMVFEKKQALG